MSARVAATMAATANTRDHGTDRRRSDPAFWPWSGKNRAVLSQMERGLVRWNESRSNTSGNTNSAAAKGRSKPHERPIGKVPWTAGQKAPNGGSNAAGTAH